MRNKNSVGDAPASVLMQSTTIEKRLDCLDSELQRLRNLLISRSMIHENYGLEGKIAGLEHCVIDSAARTEQLTAQIGRIQAELHNLTSQCPSSKLSQIKCLM